MRRSLALLTIALALCAAGGCEGAKMGEEIRETDRVIHLIRPQANFIRSEERFPAYVGSWGTGKSLALIMRAMMQSEKYPNNLGVIFRKEFTDLRDSTVRDFIDYTGLKPNSERAVVLKNGSQILFRHLEEMNNIQNMNLGWFAIEQAEELDTDDQFFKLHGRLRRANSSRSGFIIANTNGHNWIYKLWKAAKQPGYPLFEANSFAAEAYLPTDTLASWRALEHRKPKIYRRFILNSWDEADSSDVIVQPEWVNAAAQRELIIRPPLRRIVSIDVARSNPGAGDKTTFYAIENNRQLAKEEHETRNTMEVVGRGILFAAKHGCRAFAVDEIGVGGGVADRLAEIREPEKDEAMYQVIMVNAAERLPGTGFYNRRAQIHDYAAHQFEDGLVQIDPADTDLIEQLSWAKYKTVKSNGVFLVEPKEDIKARYGRSPDNADGFMNGLWALPQVNVIHAEDKYERRRRGPSGGNEGIGVLG